MARLSRGGGGLPAPVAGSKIERRCCVNIIFYYAMARHSFNILLLLLCKMLTTRYAKSEK